MKLEPIDGGPWARPEGGPPVPHADGNYYPFRTDDGEILWL